MKTSVEKKIVAGFVASVLALAVLAWLSYRMGTDSFAAQGRVERAYQVVAALEHGRALLTEAEARQRAYLLTGDVEFRNDFQKSEAYFAAWVKQVRSLTADNPELQPRLAGLTRLISRQLALLNGQLPRAQQTAASGSAALRQDRHLTQQIGQAISSMQAAENQLLARRRQAAQAGAEKTLLIILAGAGLAGAIGLVAVLLVHRDLKLRAQTEATLHQNEARLRLMIECVKDYAILMLDPDGRVVSWNEGTQRIKGYQAREIIGQHFSKFYPEDAVRAGMPERMLAQAKAGGRAEDEGWRVRKDGSRFWASVVITAMRDPAGQLRGFVKMTRDLTGQRRAEQIQAERDRFFDLSRDLLCVADFSGRFKALNPAWERVLGFSRAELRARPFIEFVHPDDRAATEAEAAKLAAGGETVSFENRYRCQDGSWRWLAWSSRADAPRQLIYATARDVTEQKLIHEQVARLHADLQLRAAQLEAANQELESFSYSVSHDLRAPLRHIDGFVKLLERQGAEKLDERGRRCLNVIADSARRMGALIDDLLVFSRMGRAELRRTKVAPEALVQEVVASLQDETRGRRVVWKLDALPEIEADPAMLRQVWANLIGNALKYTRPRNPAEIEIGCNAANGEFVFHVRDNGVGFDMQYAHKLFGVFQRLHHAEDFEGTGIGLANVQRIILRHGGRVWAEGRLDRGAAFYFSLPKTQTETKG